MFTSHLYSLSLSVHLWTQVTDPLFNSNTQIKSFYQMLVSKISVFFTDSGPWSTYSQRIHKRSRD